MSAQTTGPVGISVSCEGCGGQISVTNSPKPYPSRCYYCHNGVTPDELVGTWNLAQWFPASAVEAMRAALQAVGKDPSLAPIFLRREQDRRAAA